MGIATPLKVLFCVDFWRASVGRGAWRSRRSGWFGCGFLGVWLVFGVAFEVDLFGEAFEGFGKAGHREVAVMVPFWRIDGDVQAGLRADHIADHVFVRLFVVDPLFAVCRSDGVRLG